MIEILKKEDINQYKKLIDKCFDGSNNISIYEQYNENKNYKIIVKKIENKIVGSITIYPIDLFTFSFQPAIEVFNVCVLKEYRNQNIAKELFEFLKIYAKENNYKSIYLNCLETAINAHKLYERIGMKKVSSVKYSMEISN